MLILSFLLHNNSNRSRDVVKIHFLQMRKLIVGVNSEYFYSFLLFTLSFFASHCWIRLPSSCGSTMEKQWEKPESSVSYSRVSWIYMVYQPIKFNIKFLWWRPFCVPKIKTADLFKLKLVSIGLPMHTLQIDKHCLPMHTLH